MFAEVLSAVPRQLRARVPLDPRVPALRRGRRVSRALPAFELRFGDLKIGGTARGLDRQDQRVQGHEADGCWVAGRAIEYGTRIADAGAITQEL